MKKFLVILLSLAMITPEMFARAGSSYSRSSSSSYSRSSSSSSYSRPSQSYSRPSYTAPSRPAYARPATPHPSAVQPTARQTTVVNRTTVINRNSSGGNGGGNYNNRNNNNNNNNDGGNGGGGMGIMGTIAGVGGGIVVGNLLTSALMGDHRNAGHAPAGGYVSTQQGYPVAGQPVAPAMAGATSGNYVTDGQGGFMPAPVEQMAPGAISMGNEVGAATAPATIVEAESDNKFLKFMAWFIGGIIAIFVLFMLIKKYLVYRARKKEVEGMLEAEANIAKFEQIFKQIQSSYESGSRVNLIKLMTSHVYNGIMTTKSDNEEKGLTNYMEALQVHSIVNQSSWEEDGIKYQQVKIRFSLIDYVVNEKEEVIHGSKEKRETAVELWTFQSSSKNDWILSRIDQHGGYVHQY